MKNIVSYFLLSLYTILWVACTHSVTEPQSATPLNRLPDIFPDYVDVTIPPQFAPLRFMLRHAPEEAIVCISHEKEKMVCQASGKEGFLMDEKQWNHLVQSAIGKALEIKVYEQKEGVWQVYDSFHWYVSGDSIDPYLVYRLIEPGYELWNQMGIYQRRLTDFKESPIITNDLTGHNCMNCHSFPNQNPQQMTLHMR